MTQKDSRSEMEAQRVKSEEANADIDRVLSPMETVGTTPPANGEKTLKDAVKPKNKRKKKAHPNANAR